MTVVTHQPKPIIQDPKSPPSSVLEQDDRRILPDIFSFLSQEERTDVSQTCKQWNRTIIRMDSGLPKQMHQSIIGNGYGDFLLISTNQSTIDKTKFDQAFSIFNRYLPQVHQKPVEDRLLEVTTRVEEIDPSFKAVFIPRAVYELYYLKGAFKEESDMSKGTLGCSHSSRCWHSHRFDDDVYRRKERDPDSYNLDSPIVEQAYELNEFITSDLHLSDGLRVDQWKKVGSTILKDFDKMGEKHASLKAEREQAEGYDWMVETCPVAAMHSSEKLMRPSELDRAIDLECSADAENAIILYRGSSFETDDPRETLSYGMSLHAGLLRDSNACASTYMFNYGTTKSRYGMSVPLHDKVEDMFHVPKINTIVEMTASGEYFHPRIGFGTSNGKHTESQSQTKLHGYLDHRVTFPVEARAKGKRLSLEEGMEDQDLYFPETSHDLSPSISTSEVSSPSSESEDLSISEADLYS